ncbi:MAG: GSCFA domain-containing protein, partial [Bacteroidaceae bacterium]|nr:GSCFA domain-containing protein [Bacteroidaceae bacterium]
MPDFRTIVPLPPQAVAIGPQTRCLFLGSCFADEVGARLKAQGVRATINPTGVLYNMESIRLTLERWLAADSGGQAADGVYQGADGLWHNHFHDSRSDGVTEAACRAVSRQR